MNRRDTAAISDIESDLHATSGEISWALSLFILFQGLVPLIWSAVSEVYGRKVISLSFQFLNQHTHHIVRLSTSSLFQYVLWDVLWRQRLRVSVCLSAYGVSKQPGKAILAVEAARSKLNVVRRSSAVISIGAATLADIYDPHERGTVMGIYYWYDIAP